MEKRYSSNRANNNSRQYARNERRRKKKMRRIVLICILFVLASVTLALLVYAGIGIIGHSAPYTSPHQWWEWVKQLEWLVPV